jgi:hypothetical protein
MASLETIELKFLLKLLGCEGYRGKIVDLSPSSGTKPVERDRTCKSLGTKGLIEYESEISGFAITSAGRTLLNLDTTSLPVTPDELLALKACKGATTPGKLARVPKESRQQIILNLAERGMLKISKTTIKDVWLTAQGKQFLRNEYEPRGHSLVATGNMLANYVRFLRAHLDSVSNPLPDQSKPDVETVLQQIKQLDQQLKTDNYLPIYHLREKLQPLLTRDELDHCLYQLQKENLIELSSLYNESGYDDKISAGILQDNGSYLFFISTL